MLNKTLRLALVGLVVFAIIWLALGVAIARAYLDALWSAPAPWLGGAGLIWLLVGGAGVVGLHVRLLLYVWRLA